MLRAGGFGRLRVPVTILPIAGEPVDFDALYRTFHPRILRYLARLIGIDEAEDAAQEVFAKISRAVPETRNESQLSTWIYRIATNTALDRVRSAGYRAIPAARLSTQAAAKTSPQAVHSQARTVPLSARPFATR